MEVATRTIDFNGKEIVVVIATHGGIRYVVLSKNEGRNLVCRLNTQRQASATDIAILSRGIKESELALTGEDLESGIGELLDAQIGEGYTRLM